MQPNGEYDLRALVQQSEQLQRRMMEAQYALADTEVVGRGGNQVTVVLAATGDPKSVRIDPAVVDPDDVARLEKLVLTALTDAHAQLRTTAQAMLAPVGDLFGKMP